jgi:AhpD family alkylhydroperoxidase
MAATKASASDGPAKLKSRGARATAGREKSIAKTAARKSARRAPRRPSPRVKSIESVAHRKRTHAKSPAPIGPSRKPTLGTDELASRLASLLAELPRIYAIWNNAALDPAFREELMVAVARQNDAPYCTWAHSTWAESVGASKAELAKVAQLNRDSIDRRKWAALTYVRALAAKDFKPVPRKIRQEMQAHYTPREIEDITLVARVMELMNRSANTYEAMLSRLQGEPREDTRIIDEMVLTGVFLAVTPLMLLLLSRNAKRSYVDTTRSMIGYVNRFYAEKARG